MAQRSKMRSSARRPRGRLPWRRSAGRLGQLGVGPDRCGESRDWRGAAPTQIGELSCFASDPSFAGFTYRSSRVAVAAPASVKPSYRRALPGQRLAENRSGGSSSTLPPYSFNSTSTRTIPIRAGRVPKRCSRLSCVRELGVSSDGASECLVKADWLDVEQCHSGGVGDDRWHGEPFDQWFRYAGVDGCDEPDPQ